MNIHFPEGEGEVRPKSDDFGWERRWDRILNYFCGWQSRWARILNYFCGHHKCKMNDPKNRYVMHDSIFILLEMVLCVLITAEIRRRNPENNHFLPLRGLKQMLIPIFTVNK